MTNFILFLNALILLSFQPKDPVFYQSPALKDIVFYSNDEKKDRQIKDDVGDNMEIKSLQSKDGQRFWYRRIFTPVCLSGECKPVDVGIYWHFTGKYLGIEIYKEPLTKTDHSEFDASDYARLEEILVNEWSDLREYSAEDLVEPMEIKPVNVDAVTSATKKSLSKSAVKGALYTTHTLWHLIHVGESEQLSLMARTELAADSKLVKELLDSNIDSYRGFILQGLIEGSIGQDPVIVRLILEGMKQADVASRNQMLKALEALNLADPEIQEGIAQLYPQLDTSEKMRVLIPLTKSAIIYPSLKSALFADFDLKQSPWVLIKVLEVFEKSNLRLSEVEYRKIANFETANKLLKTAINQFLQIK